MPIKAPFRFARINRWIYEPAWADLVSHDVPFADGLSGEAVVEITARSSILVGGDRRKATADQAGEVRPFQLPDGGYAIPGSALQGMARSILEVAGFGRLGPWVADRKFGIRDLSGTPTARAHYQDRLSEKVGNHVTINSRAGWLMKSKDGSPYILPCKYARIRLDDVLKFKQALLESPNPPPAGVLCAESCAKERYKWFMGGLPGGTAALSANFDIEDPQDHSHNKGNIRITYSRCSHATTGGGTPGTLVLTGKPQGGTGGGDKKWEFVFYGHDRRSAKTAGTAAANAQPVSADVWDAFLLLHEEQLGQDANPNWDFWQAEFDNGHPIPVFYWRAGGKITALGTAFAFKVAHGKSIRDLLGHSDAGHLEPVEKMKLDLAHLIFGVAAEHDDGRGLKRRAHFGLARADGVPRLCRPARPSILLGPKPSYAGLYVRQRHDNHPLQNDELLATYSPRITPEDPHLHRPELSGVKIWPARDAGQFDPDEVHPDLAGSLQVQTNLFTLPPRTVFRSRLTFHNLRPVELGAVLWALSYGEADAFGDDPNAVTMRHRLGMGKPLGLGEVTIRVTGLKTEAACPSSNLAASGITAAKLVHHFKAHMKSASVYGPEWSKSKQVRALLKAATPSPAEAQDLRYMTLNEYQDAKGRRHPASPAEYLKDYAPNGSHEVAGSGTGGSAPGLICPWVDETIASLKKEIPEPDESKILRGRKLACRWQEIEDSDLQQSALKDIVARWKAKGWWHDPPPGVARRVKQIYERGV